jgi:hypothetical protein
MVVRGTGFSSGKAVHPDKANAARMPGVITVRLKDILKNNVLTGRAANGSEPG